MTDIVRMRMLIGGNLVGSKEYFPSRDPATGVAWAEIPDASDSDVDNAVEAAGLAGSEGEWSGMLASERGRILERVADLVESHADELARCESRDNGKLYREMRGQTGALPRWYRFFGGLADKLEGSVVCSDQSDVLNYTVREPVGVVAVLVPWNSPLLLATWSVAPALAAGCTVVIKPSEVASASLLRFAELLEQSELPPGVVNVVSGLGPTVGKALVSHPRVAKVAFTGSPETARAIAMAAGNRLAPTLFELGGKSANIVFEDAQVEAAEAGVLAGVFAASGQTCIAGSRLLVHRAIEEAFVSRIVDRAKSVRLGDPFKADTQMGPVASPEQLEKIEGFVRRAERDGAKIAAGGVRRREGKGLFFEPTVLTNIHPDMEIAQEEVFGPVLSVIPFEDEAEAVRIANGTPYGLAAGVWTRDVKRAHRLAHRLRSGSVWINMYRAVAPMSPFGGVGLSGYGRENGLGAVAEFLTVKSIWLDLSERIQDPFSLRV